MVSYHFRKGDKTEGFREVDKKAIILKEYSSSPKTEQIKFLPKINLQRFFKKVAPDSLK